MPPFILLTHTLSLSLSQVSTLYIHTHFLVSQFAHSSSKSHSVMNLTMASQVYSAAPRTSVVQNYALQGFIANQPAMVDVSGELMRRKERRLRLSFRVKASLDATAAAKVGQVTEVTKDTFWPIVKAAGDKTVVLDMYTQWCGPCKIIAPKFKKLSEKYDDVVFLKLDCSSDNRPLAKELGIKVVPTFKIFKDNKFVKEVTGAKLDDLVVAIESARSV